MIYFFKVIVFYYISSQNIPIHVLIFRPKVNLESIKNNRNQGNQCNTCYSEL